MIKIVINGNKRLNPCALISMQPMRRRTATTKTLWQGNYRDESILRRNTFYYLQYLYNGVGLAYSLPATTMQSRPFSTDTVILKNREIKHDEMRVVYVDPSTQIKTSKIMSRGAALALADDLDMDLILGESVRPCPSNIIYTEL